MRLAKFPRRWRARSAVICPFASLMPRGLVESSPIHNRRLHLTTFSYIRDYRAAITFQLQVIRNCFSPSTRSRFCQGHFCAEFLASEDKNHHGITQWWWE